MTDALFDLTPAAPVEPWSCTGTSHEHRWIRFDKNGRRDVALIHVTAGGHVDCSEQAIAVLLREAGYEVHDVDARERASATLRARLQARLLATIPGRNR